MNKTLKTIAWICIALGLLGMAADASALVFDRKLMSERLASFEEMRANNEAGQVPAVGRLCIAEDSNNDGKPDGDCLQLQQLGQPGQPGAGQPGFGSQQGQGGIFKDNRMNFNGGRTGRGGLFKDNRMDFNGGCIGARVILPLFFFALGPVLAIVGVVILLVNRQPKSTAKVKAKEVKKADKAKK